MKARRVLLALLATVGVLIVCELAFGALDFGETTIGDACTTSANFDGSGVDGAVQRFALSAISGAACELGVSREELVLSLVPSAGGDRALGQGDDQPRAPRTASSGRPRTRPGTACSEESSPRCSTRSSPTHSHGCSARQANSIPRVALSYQEMIATLQDYWGEAGLRDHAAVPHGARCGNGQSGDVPSLASARTRGRSRTSSRASGRPTAATARTRIASSSYYQYQVLLKPAPDDVLDLYFGSLSCDRHRPRSATTSVSSRTTGSSRRSAPGASAGRSGATAWRSRSSRTSSRSAASSSTSSPRR